MTDSESLDDIVKIRKRPAMYLGGTDFFGFVQYLVSAFDLMLEQGATWIEIEINDNIHLSSDAYVPLRRDEQGKLEPYEVYLSLQTEYHHLSNATILNALSEWLQLVTSDGQTQTEIKYQRGERKQFQQESAVTSEAFVRLEFTPDTTIFSVTDISPAVLYSYCRRISCLYPGVAIRIKSAESLIEYKSENGIRNLFDSITSPYQILHKPIQICESSGDLSVESVFVFHSWSENCIWSFANRGRVPDGGTHETGLTNAIASLQKNSESDFSVGVLAVLAIQYPHVAYEGCIKGRIGNPELIDGVANLVSTGIQKWVAENPAEVEYLKKIERFQFGAIW